MKAFIFGAGAHGRVTLDILRAQNIYESIEFIDENQQLWGQEINGVPIVGGLDYAGSQNKTNSKMVVALGNPHARLNIVKKAKDYGIFLLNAIHPSAVVVSTASLGEGNTIGANSVINSNAIIANNVIINTSAVVEHDSMIADGASVSPGVQVGGRVIVEQGAFLGTGTIILPRITIGEGAVVAAGSVVTKNVPKRVMVLGVPARIVKEIDADFDWQTLL